MPVKTFHEIRDPIHVFVKLDDDEREVLNSRPFQRLRHIHQLALTYLVYPGATHKRFEHSLGVMELAGRVFDVITNPNNVSDPIRNALHPLRDGDERSYWRSALRMAALCHDIGHLPFSHAAEAQLLPEGWDHERMTREFICSDEMKSIWCSVTPPLRPTDLVKLAVGPRKASDLEFSDWEAILSEVIVGDAFGVDRMDYLLRDSHHVGVAYGKFDHYRLIDTLRILLPPANKDGRSEEPGLGVERGGLESAEALMLARYFMYSQVYLHHIRRIYDIHLTDFLKEWLPGGEFSTELASHLKVTDNEITGALLTSAFDGGAPGHIHARRIIRRQHFKVVYERNPADVEINPEAGKAVFDALCNEFGAEHFRHDRYQQRGGSTDFTVRLRDGAEASSLSLSQTLKNVPVVSVDNVFADRSVIDKASGWRAEHRPRLIKPNKEGVGNG